MNLELSVTSEVAKRQALRALEGAGFRVTSGSVRLAHPFSICVEELAVTHVETVRELVSQVDPDAVIMAASPTA